MNKKNIAKLSEMMLLIQRPSVYFLRKPDWNMELGLEDLNGEDSKFLNLKRFRNDLRWFAFDCVEMDSVLLYIILNLIDFIWFELI